jgi:hypothetical protein
MISISYAVTVCDELEEIQRLIPFLFEHKQEQDEIVVQYDRTGVTDDVLYYLDTLNGKIKIGSAPLNNDFASFKNAINKMCSAEIDYIFQLDADEMPNELLLQNIHDIIEDNDVDLLYVPRINTVDGLTQQHIDKWKWHVNSDGWVNFPDYQSRIYRNNKNIRWINKVHEQIIGFKTFSKLPSYEQLCLYHHKTIDKQERQNQFYNTL